VIENEKVIEDDDRRGFAEDDMNIKHEKRIVKQTKGLAIQRTVTIRTQITKKLMKIKSRC
jgi:hypothetical protein